MSAPRSARLEVRVTPAQRALIGHVAAMRGKTLSEYVVETLVGAAQRDASVSAAHEGMLGWMRGTATINGDLTEPTDASGWTPGELPE